MKRYYFLIKAGLVTVVFLYSVVSLTAQCTITATGFPAEENGFFSQNNSDTNTDGQKFTDCNTGNVTSISIKMDATNTYTGTMNLWLGTEPGVGNKFDG